MATVTKVPELDASAQAIAEATANSQYVTFTCGRTAYGIEIMAVREIRSWSPTTPLPNQSVGAEGVLDIRGKVVQVFDLAVLLGSARQKEPGPGQVVLVVAVGPEEIALSVDSVSDIIYAREDDKRPAPNRPQGGLSVVSFLVRTEDRLIGILDLPALFPDYFQILAA